MLTPAIRAILVNSCQLRAANVNSTLYPNQTAGESGKALFRPAYKPSVSLASTLALLVFLVAANHEQHTLAPHDLAVAADLFN
jgi:hypothetical protein